MKKKFLIAAIIGLLYNTVFAFSTSTKPERKPINAKELVKKLEKKHTDTVFSYGYPCPCSKFVCADTSCKGSLTWKADAFPIYDKTRKCQSCEGTDPKCTLCSGTGYKWLRTDPGCECSECKKLYRQPECK